MLNVAFISSGYYPLYVSYAALYAACCTLGINAEYVFVVYAVRGGRSFLTGRYYRPPFLRLFPAIICGFLSKHPYFRFKIEIY